MHVCVYRVYIVRVNMLVFYNCIYSFNCLTGAMARWLGFQSCGAAAALLEFITIETLNLWLITFLTIHFRDINGNLFELILDFIDNHSFFIPYHTTHWSDWFANRKSEMRKTTSKKSLRSMKTSFDQSTLMYNIYFYHCCCWWFFCCWKLNLPSLLTYDSWCK